MADDTLDQIKVINREQVPLFAQLGGDRQESLQTVLMKAQGEEAASRQGVTLGEQQHPYDFIQVKSFVTANEHHSTCIYTKVAATVGLGFIDSQEETILDEPDGLTQASTDAGFVMPPKTSKIYTDSKVDLAMNPLCMISATDLLHDICEDFWSAGNGYIEVVREKGSLDKIVGLHHIPAEEITVFLEDMRYNFHYVLKGNGTNERRFARFGDTEDFLTRAGEGSGVFALEDAASDTVSEVIHFRQPSGLSRWYGFAKWLSAVPIIELAQMLMQWKFDFFLNRGVPEFIFLLVGQKLKADDWKKIEDALKANIGLGNSHKSLALNIANPEVKAQVEKLAAESKGEDTFATTKETLALSVVTAHRVPPLLAGIQIPGKLGASN